MPEAVLTAATAIVDAAGITDFTLRTQAIFDIAVSGDAEFAQAYVDLPVPQSTFTPSGAPSLTTVGVLAGEDVAEGGTARFEVFRTGDTSTAATFGYTLSGDISAADLQAGTLSGTISFAMDESSKVLSIALVDDDLVEGDERLTFELDASETPRFAPSASLVVLDTEEAPNAPPAGRVAIQGVQREGETLIADLSELTDADGIQTDSFGYQWQRNGAAIPGADAASYLVTEADALETISLMVSYIDERGKAESLASAEIIPAALDRLVQGDGTPERLEGGKGDDTIRGAGGNDSLTGGIGDDILMGDEGIDTGHFGGPQSAFTLTLSPTEISITDRSTPSEGTDQLTSVELLDFDTEIPLFSDNPMNLDIFDGPTGLTAVEFSAIIELYIAYFNRAPDALGLSYWGTEYSNGFSIPQMATNFFYQPETQSTYASLLDENGLLDLQDRQKVEAFATEIYRNVLGREPDQDGLDYWIEELQNNALITPDIFILAIINGAKNPSVATSQTVLDQEYLAVKTDLGAYFSVIKGMSDLGDAAASLALFNAMDIEGSRDATIAAIDQHYADALDPVTGDFLMQLVGVIDDPFGVG